jgi:hypothetical protein
MLYIISIVTCSNAATILHPGQKRGLFGRHAAAPIATSGLLLFLLIPTYGPLSRAIALPAPARPPALLYWLACVLLRIENVHRLISYM